MERLTRRDLADVNGRQIVLCDSKEEDCNDSCLYRRCKWNEKALRKLKEYEDAEEQGLLLRLPFSLGQAIYWIATKCDIGLEEDDACDKYECDECPYNETLAVAKGTVKTYHIIRFLEGTLERQYFLTKEEAEQALARMENR